MHRFFLMIFVATIGFGWSLISSLYAQDLVPVEEEVLAPTEERKNIDVVYGIDFKEDLTFIPARPVSIGNEAVLTYILVPEKKQIIFKGLKPTENPTSVDIRDQSGDIKARYLVRVTANDKSMIISQLKDFLGDIEGLEIGYKGDRIYVGGEIVVPGDIGKLALILRQDAFKDVLNLVELSPQSQLMIAQRMEKEINATYKNVRVRVVNKLFWLEGEVPSNDAKMRADEIAKAFLPDSIETLARSEEGTRTMSVPRAPIQNFITVNSKPAPEPPPKLIKFTSQFVELSKDYNKVFGFKWVPLMAGTGGSIRIGKSEGSGLTTATGDGNGGEGTLTATISNLFPKLASAKSAGHARVIQSGVLIVEENTGNATITKNHKKPFSIGSGEFMKADVAESKFVLNIAKPRIMPEENVSLGVGITVSSALEGNETQVNEISTNITVKSKSSAVIGGISVAKNATSFDRNPPGGIDSYENGSPLFSFVRSKSYMSNKTQFAVFLTPEIIESASAGTEQIKKKFRQRR